jgi:hypothetical protein
MGPTNRVGVGNPLRIDHDRRHFTSPTHMPEVTTDLRPATHPKLAIVHQNKHIHWKHNCVWLASKLASVVPATNGRSERRTVLIRDRHPEGTGERFMPETL